MTTKDVVSLAISALALLLSVIATSVSLRRGAEERRRTLRSQLSDVLGKLGPMLIEVAKSTTRNNITRSGVRASSFRLV